MRSFAPFVLSIFGALVLSGCSAVTGSLSGSLGQSSQSAASSSSQSISGSSAGGGAEYRAMWDGYRDPTAGYTGADLTRITLRELNHLPAEFYSLVPRDAAHWCPAFSRLNISQRKAFYLALVSGIARYESDFRASGRYLEAGGHYSRGLLQLGQLALSYYPKSRCDVSGDPTQLHDLSENITCGVMLLNHWITRDGHVAAAGNVGGADARFFGGARYWSTLRPGHRGYDGISAFTRSLPMCQR